MRRELSRDDCVGLMPEWKDLDPQIESLSGGITNQNADFLRKETLESLIRLIRKIHESGLTLSRRFDPSVEARRLCILLGKVAPEYPEFDIATTLKQLDRISELAAVAPSEYRPCHNDLLADNFIRKITFYY